MSPDVSRKYSKRLSNGEAAAYLGISPSKLNKLRAAGAGPEVIRVGRKCLYDTLALDEFLAAHSERVV
jgi:hypothetical protein